MWQRKWENKERDILKGNRDERKEEGGGLEIVLGKSHLPSD